jgi:hypothetical protein
MHIYQQIYEFAASAGAFEGYVYHKTESDMDMDALLNWVNNLVDAHRQLPADIRGEFQSSCDRTLGRAMRSLISALGEEQEIIAKLQEIVKGELPDSADDFQKTKWFQK